MVWMSLGKTNLGMVIRMAQCGYRTNSQFCFNFHLPLSYPGPHLRIPMVEGSTPFSFVEMDRVLDKIDETSQAGHSVLVHCRGGKLHMTRLSYT